jgi:phosphoribosylglycinamide formyltransferase-1
MTSKKRTAILISGRGSNMRALAEAARAPDYPAEIVLVVSNRRDAAGIEWAKANGLTTSIIDQKAHTSREGFEAELQKALKTANVELIALAGFMRLITPAFVEHWQDRMINIHPSLLPNFKGLHAHEQAIAAGVKISGCTVHYVRAEMDTGPIIAQAAVPVLPDDTPEALSARVLKAEHGLYPAALKLVASGKTRVESNKVFISEHVISNDVLFSPHT